VGNASIMKTIDWHFDFISPFAYLASESLARLSDTSELRLNPILFAGLLQHHVTKGPAEIPAMRRFTFRHIRWLADRHGIVLKPPPAHPFNPLPLLRLAIAIDADLEQVQRLFRFVWAEGKSQDDEKAWHALLDEFGITEAEIASDPVKARLRQTTDAAIEAGIFGVPSFVVDGEIFWGFDAMEFLVDYLEDPNLLQTPGMRAIDAMPDGVQRRS
jgi:2-hydroxychromene-2-carboxylate isomerase